MKTVEYFPPFFVAAMEDILEVYRRPYNENFAVVCMDENPLQLLSDA